MSLTRRLLFALLLLVAILTVGTVGYELLAGARPLDALYMTVITLSTVGYGEVLPGMDTNPTARVFTMALILAGMGILLYVVSLTTAFFVEGELTNLIRRRKMDKSIAALQGHVILCGAGTTGIHVVEELIASGLRFIVIESSQANIDKALAGKDFPYIEGDATAEELLIRAGIERARGVISVLSSDKDNLFVTFTARQLNPGIRIVTRGIQSGIRERLLRAGANAVVFPNHIGGLRMASEMVRPKVVGFLDRMLRPGPETWRVEEVEVTAGSPTVGQSLGSLQIMERVGLPVLAILEQTGDGVLYYPPPDTPLQQGARLVVLAERKQVERLEALIKRGG